MPFNPFSPYNRPTPALPAPQPAVTAPEPAAAAVETPALPFDDVEGATELYGIVLYAYENGIMNGVSATKFDPYGTLTRGMVVTILWRMEGEPDAPYTGAFTDVPSGAWFTEGVEWAASNGIVNGYGNGKFGPADEVTREQLAAVLYRYAQFKGCEITADGFISDGNISPWAVEYVNWAAANGILRVSGGTIRATENALRWEVADAIRAFLGNVTE